MKYHNSSTYILFQAALLLVLYIGVMTLYGALKGTGEDFWFFAVLWLAGAVLALKFCVLGTKIEVIDDSLLIKAANNTSRGTYMPFGSIKKLTVRQTACGTQLTFEDVNGHKAKAYPNDAASLLSLLKSHGVEPTK